MAERLLTSEKFVKGVTAISDNIAGNYLLPSIREAQEIHLQGILGANLLDKLKSYGQGDKMPEKYAILRDKCQYYLAYMSVVELMDKVSFKICNFGVTRTTDDNMESASYDDIVRQKDLYRGKADHQAYVLQGWLLEHRNDYPELNECECRRLHANLYTSASCGIFLGGAYGRRK